MESTSSTPSSEGQALDTLKSKINNPSYPTLDLARAIQQHIQAYPQTQKALAEKLQVKESVLSEIASLLKLPAASLQKLEGQAIRLRDIRKFKSSVEGVESSVEPVESPVESVKSVEFDVEDPQKGQINGIQRVYSYKERSNPFNEGFPLLKDTVNAVSRLVFFWAKEADLGGLVERWAIKLRSYGWLKTAFGILAVALAGYGGMAATRDIQGKWSSTTVFGRGPISHSAPALISSRWISGHRLELRWQPQTEGTNYRVYWHSRDGRSVDPVGDISTPGAIVNLAYSSVRRGGAVSVTAITPQDEESAHSPLISFEPTAVNQEDLVEQLPISGITTNGGAPEQPRTKEAGSGNSYKGNLSPPSRSAASPDRRLSGTPAPSEIHAEVKTPDLILLSWRAVGNTIRYNVYSSGSRDLAALRKENAQPLKANRVEWTPETGLPRYWIVVTSLDEAGKESAYSEAIEVVRNPEKSNAASDAAAGILRKVLPW